MTTAKFMSIDFTSPQDNRETSHEAEIHTEFTHSFGQ